MTSHTMRWAVLCHIEWVNNVTKSKKSQMPFGHLMYIEQSDLNIGLEKKYELDPICLQSERSLGF